MFFNKPFKAFLEGYMFKDKPNPLYARKNLLFRCGGVSSFLHIAIFFCAVFIYKPLA